MPLDGPIAFFIAFRQTELSSSTSKTFLPLDLGDRTGFTGRAVEANFFRRCFKICFIPSLYHKYGNYSVSFAEQDIRRTIQAAVTAASSHFPFFDVLDIDVTIKPI